MPYFTGTLRVPQWVPTGYPYVGTPSGTHIEVTLRGRTMCSHRPHFVGLNGHPTRGTHMGTLSGTHFSVPLREIIAPSGQACMHVGCPMEVRTYFARFHFVISFSFAGSFGPSNAPFGCIWVPLRAPTFKNNGLEPIP